MAYLSAETIKTLREERGLTQKQLGERINVSDKTISKWETGRGLPDITLVEPLSQALGVSLAELISGRWSVNRNRAGNLLRGKFYVCPLCGNVIYAAGEGSYSCCGIQLPPLEPETAPEDLFRVEQVEYDYFITADHPMEKSHYLSFFAYVTLDRVRIGKLYPEQDAQCRFPMQGPGKLYAYCNRHGLWEIPLKRRKK